MQISTRRLEKFLNETEVHSFFPIDDDDDVDDKEQQVSVEYRPVASDIPMVELMRPRLDETVLTTMEAVTEENEDDSDGVFLPNESTVSDRSNIYSRSQVISARNPNSPSLAVTVSDAAFSWSSSDLLPVLQNISISVPTGNENGFLVFRHHFSWLQKATKQTDFCDSSIVVELYMKMDHCSSPLWTEF